MNGGPDARDPVLTLDERAMLHGADGEASAFALGLIVKLARVLGARSLVPVASAHIDGCLYHGRASIDFVERLVALGGRVRIPTTLNVGSLDLLHPNLILSPPSEVAGARELMDGYVALGARPTWTCAPYQLPERPAVGQHIAWAESNAVVFANSVLGARTDRYGDFVDACAALTGRAPFAGLHLEENRRGRIVFNCSALPSRSLREDAVWGALGHFIGRRSGALIPVITGVDATVSEDNLKALGAAAASAGGVGMFHVVGVTPEAATLEDALHGDRADDTVAVTMADLRGARKELSTAESGVIDAVSVGTPHFSRDEFAALAELLAGGPAFSPNVQFWVSTSRTILEEAEQAGYAEICRDAGATILVDTCTYVTSVLRPQVRTVMTNSAKWAWYAPANLGVDVIFGTLADCVVSARTGHAVRDEGSWQPAK
jgi:predicted aconitase